MSLLQHCIPGNTNGWNTLGAVDESYGGYCMLESMECKCFSMVGAGAKGEHLTFRGILYCYKYLPFFTLYYESFVYKYITLRKFRSFGPGLDDMSNVYRCTLKTIFWDVQTSLLFMMCTSSHLHVCL